MTLDVLHTGRGMATPGWLIPDSSASASPQVQMPLIAAGTLHV